MLTPLQRTCSLKGVRDDSGGIRMVRNKTVGFPEKKPNGEARAKSEYGAKRANGTINTRPQERARKSSQRDHTNF